MKRTLIINFLFILTIVSCTNKILISSYFQPLDKRQKYTAEFYPRFSGSKLVKDSSIVFVRQFNVDNQKAFYITDNLDTTNEFDISLSNDYFLQSAIILREDSFALAPIKLYGIRDLTLEDFKFVYPLRLRLTDTIRLLDGNKKILFYGFNFDNIVIKGRLFRKCLNIKISQIWPTVKYDGDQVWLDKKYGVIKWLRGGDGSRVEEIELRD